MENKTSSNGTQTLPCPSFRPFTETEKWFQVSSFLLIAVVSIFGNTVVISIIKKTQRLHSPTNYFIVNLCFANLLIAVLNTTPYIQGRIAPHLGFVVSGLVGTIVCKLQAFLGVCTFNAAILTLAIIAADRFIAIFFPLRRAINSRKAIWLIAASWIIPALTSSILFYVYDLFEVGGTTYCFVFWPPGIATIFSAADLIVFYALPLLEIIIFYTAIIYKIWMRKIPGQATTANQQLELKAKKNVLKMLIVAVLTFALFWLPLKIVFLIDLVRNSRCFVTPTLRFLTFFFACMNCAINPFIYIVFSRDYRNGFKAIFHCSPRLVEDLPHVHSRSMDITEVANSVRHSGRLTLRSFRMKANT